VQLWDIHFASLLQLYVVVLQALQTTKVSLVCLFPVRVFSQQHTSFNSSAMWWSQAFALVFFASACAARVVDIGPIGLQYAAQYRHRAFHLDGDSEYDEKPGKMEILSTLFDTCADRSISRLDVLKKNVMRRLQMELYKKTTTPPPIQAPESLSQSSIPSNLINSTK